jgi:hypothetical protein
VQPSKSLGAANTFYLIGFVSTLTDRGALGLRAARTNTAQHFLEETIMGKMEECLYNWTAAMIGAKVARVPILTDGQVLDVPAIIKIGEEYFSLLSTYPLRYQPLPTKVCKAKWAKIAKVDSSAYNHRIVREHYATN